jgi:hypothetical protein
VSEHPRTLKNHVTASDPAKQYEIELVTVTDRNAVIAAVNFYGRDGNSLYSTGSAKRHPGDKISDAGEMLAIGRALTALGQYFEVAGNERVDYQS